jgi:glutamate synthase domain-containing protein 3
MLYIDAKGIYYRDLNKQIRTAITAGETEFVLANINGQRYIGGGINQRVKIDIYGVPGNDLATFMDGPTVIIHNNAQDDIGNTMNSGKIIVHGNVGDVIGYGMRGGKILIEGDVGYRVGIHMKGYRNQIPILVIGGTAGDFFAEYLAGGIIVLLGLTRNGKAITGDYLGTGMHGGVIYMPNEIEQYKLGKEVGIKELDDQDKQILTKLVNEYCTEFEVDPKTISLDNFIKLYPQSLRPYGKLYCY